MAEEEKDDWLDDLDGDDEASELDQSDIESLLSSDDIEDSPSEDVEAGEIDSADIDSLLSGTEDEMPAPPVQESSDSGVEGESDIDQSDIDALLSETESTGEKEDTIEDPDQNEIDMLFSEVDDGDTPEGDPFQAEEIDFKDVIGSDQGGDDDSFLDGTGTAFDADEFGIDDDMPDIPDFNTSSEDESTSLFDDGDQETVASDEDTALMDSEDSGKTGGIPEKIALILANMPPALQSRKTQGIIGGCLLVVILLGVFLFRGDEEVQEVAEQTIVEKTAITDQPSASPKINAPPVVKDTEFSMTQGTELAINLTAEDAEGDALSYEILSLPLHGRLSGEAPGLIYIPSKDFSGQDSFMFRVSDGTNISQPANVKISGAVPQVAVNLPVQASKPPQTPAQTKQTVKPKKLTIAAKNKSYKVDSTNHILIDWEDLWSSANYLPFTKNVAVEILPSNLHGKLNKIGDSQSLYVPDKYYSGQEKIRYRFKLGKTLSKVRELNISVKLGSPPPTIKLAKMLPVYLPGETVVIDAAESRDEKRASVKFTWQQISGVPVQLEFLNQEESQVAFVVPASFNTVANPGPVLRLIATDEDGQTDTQDIKVESKSRRVSAMWRGLAGGGLAEDPYCPYDNCPGGLLPWPYDD